MRMQHVAEVTPGREKRKQDAIKTKQKLSPVYKSPRKGTRREQNITGATKKEAVQDRLNRSRDTDTTMGGDTPPKTNVIPNLYQRKETKTNKGLQYIQAV